MSSSTAPNPDCPLRVLVVTELFPNAIAPTFAVYNGLQCTALSKLCEVHVQATIPWFPGARMFNKTSAAARFADVPAEEERDGLRVQHPRFFFIPKFGQPLSPALYAASLWPQVRQYRGRVDVVLGCWAYPDGLAAVMLAKLLGVAAAVKVHGSDLNVLPKDRKLRALMSWGLPKVNRLIAVSRPLGERAVELGVPSDRIEVVRNGIDRDIFKLRDQAEARRELGLEADKRWIVYVGRIDKAKGVLDLIEAFRAIAPAHPDLRLAIVGDGPEMDQCRQGAAGLDGRVSLPGSCDMPAVAKWIAASDVLTLPSWNEGTPNVLLEAFACGRRVVSTSVGGIPDVVTSRMLGELVAPRDVAALGEALARVAYEPYNPQDLVDAAPYSWPESAARLRDVLRDAVAHHARARATA